MESFKKNWVMYLGISFIFAAFLYFLKHAIEQDWLPPVVRVALGLILGISGVFSGLYFFQNKKNITAQTISGMGVGILYATLSYAALSEELLWSAQSLIISMTAITGIIVYFAHTYQLRILTFISIFCGLLAPIFIPSAESQVWLLFFFVLTLNSLALLLGALHKWKELSIMSFIITLIIYSCYYVLFDPEHWKQPFFYISIFFILYHIGLFFSAIIQRDNVPVVNVFLGLVNAIHYVMWSVFILSDFEVSYAVPTIISGLMFLMTALAFHKLVQKSALSSGLYFGLGLVVIAIAGGDLGMHFNFGNMKYVIITAVWQFLILAAFVVAKIIKSEKMQMGSMVAMGILLSFWLSHAWDVEWVAWFGVKFIPFINPGALVWMAFAAIGFAYSAQLSDKKMMPLSRVSAIISHLVVGGLLTIQTQNTWDAYDIQSVGLPLVLSTMWMLYALLILLWGVYRKDVLYKTVSSAVIIITGLKVFFLDLQGAASIQKVLFLVLLGGITLLISYVSNRFLSEDTNTKELEDQKV